MISLSDQLEILAACTGPALLGIASGLARHARDVQNGRIKRWTETIATLAMSVFTAIITGLLLEMVELPATVVMGITGLSGYAGGTILDAILWRATRVIKTADIPGVHCSEKPYEDGNA